MRTLSEETRKTALHALLMRREELKKYAVDPADDDEGRAYWSNELRKANAAIRELELAS